MKEIKNLNDVRELTNLILFEEFNFGIEGLQLSNSIFKNIEEITN